MFSNLAKRRRKYDLLMLNRNCPTKWKASELFNLRASHTHRRILKLVVAKDKTNTSKFFFLNRAGTEFGKFSRTHQIPLCIHAFKKQLDNYFKG